MQIKNRICKGISINVAPPGNCNILYGGLGQCSFVELDILKDKIIGLIALTSICKIPMIGNV